MAKACHGKTAGPEESGPQCHMRIIIERIVAYTFGLEPEDLRMATRGCARAAFARQTAMYLAHVSLGITYTEVGRMFGRDRTTVAYGCSVVEDRRDDPRFDHAMELLELTLLLLVLVCQGKAREPPAPWLEPEPHLRWRPSFGVQDEAPGPLQQQGSS